MIVRRHCLLAAIWLFAGIADTCSAYPTGTQSFEELAKAPVIATCIVEEISRSKTPAASTNRAIVAHATLRVLRTFPDVVAGAHAGARIQLDYEALPGDSTLRMNGPDVPNLSLGTTVVFPLKANPEPSSGAWRLILDEGQGLVIPAIPSQPPYSQSRNAREFLLHEIASVLISGTRSYVLAEASYVSGQATISAELMKLLEPKIGADEDRWAMITACLLSSLGVPRPTVAELRSGKNPGAGDHFTGSFIEALLQRLGDSKKARELLIHELLVNSDIAAWGAGMTLREFAQEPSLIRELRTMLESRRAGSMSVALDILRAGQKEILGDATALALHYIATPGTSPSELQPACWVIRDFGSDEQFGRFISEIRKSQFRDRHHYDELWRYAIWSDNKRERAVLAILLADQRIFEDHQRYSDIARDELARIQKSQ